MFIHQSQSFEDLGLTIYDRLDQHPKLLIPTRELETLLKTKLKGLKLDQPIRTRSKVVKSAICRALGYPIPKTFLKTQPRFPGQDFDVYVQKSDNLQIWNEALSPARRYVLVRVSEDNRVTNVRVLNGQQLAKLDTTGTLTKKYQATAIDDVLSSRLVSPNDTPNLMFEIQESKLDFFRQLLPIDLLFVRLQELMGRQLDDPGADQERNRGWALHQWVSQVIGLPFAEDDGQVPDVRQQLLELKLQTSPTVDLGLISPGSIESLDGFDETVKENPLRFADIRYAIFYGTSQGNKIRIDHLVLTSGADFFCFFKPMAGNVVNKKNQIRLPESIWEKVSPE